MHGDFKKKSDAFETDCPLLKYDQMVIVVAEIGGVDLRK